MSEPEKENPTDRFTGDGDDGIVFNPDPDSRPGFEDPDSPTDEESPPDDSAE